MSIRHTMGRAGVCCLLAVMVAVLESSVQAQEVKGPTSLDQALRVAAFNGRIEKVRSSLDQGAKPNHQDQDGRTALMMAAFNGHMEIARVLLERGAKVGTQDGSGRTALMYAASGPHPDTVHLLLDQGADANVRDKGEGWTALMFAAAEGQTDVVQVLLDRGADKTVADTDGDTALDFAVKSGYRATTKMLGGE